MALLKCHFALTIYSRFTICVRKSSCVRGSLGRWLLFIIYVNGISQFRILYKYTINPWNLHKFQLTLTYDCCTQQIDLNSFFFSFEINEGFFLDRTDVCGSILSHWLGCCTLWVHNVKISCGCCCCFFFSLHNKAIIERPTTIDIIITYRRHWKLKCAAHMWHDEIAKKNEQNIREPEFRLTK